MTTYLWDLFTGEQLDLAIANGYVDRKSHPTEPLAILNYSRQTQWESAWNAVTRQCRGLVVRIDTGEVVARPFEKFFNLGQFEVGEIPNEPFDVFDKMDGSLGVLHPLPSGGYAISTRGSFSSPQAQWATDFLQPWLDRFYPDPELTYLFEIIYPENRIVVDYGGLSTIVLLDILETSSGRSVMDEAQQDHRAWPGRQVNQWDGFTALDELSRDEADNREGYVVRYESGLRVKVKFAEYVRLHRILTETSSKTVYEVYAGTDMLERGVDAKRVATALGIPVEEAEHLPTFEEMLESTPDEFDQWVRTQTANLQDAFDYLEDRVLEEYATARYRLGDNASRRAFAEAIGDSDHKDVLFLVDSGRDYSAAIWSRLKPAYIKAFSNQEPAA